MNEQLHPQDPVMAQKLSDDRVNMLIARFASMDPATQRQSVTELLHRVADLKCFKAYVHKRLDSMGIAADPDPDRTEETGCRIGSRLNEVEKRLEFDAGFMLEQHDSFNLGGGWSIGKREGERWCIYYRAKHVDCWADPDVGLDQLTSYATAAEAAAAGIELAKTAAWVPGRGGQSEQTDSTQR